MLAHSPCLFGWFKVNRGFFFCDLPGYVTAAGSWTLTLGSSSVVDSVDSGCVSLTTRSTGAAGCCNQMSDDLMITSDDAGNVSFSGLRR